MRKNYQISISNFYRNPTIDFVLNPARLDHLTQNYQNCDFITFITINKPNPNPNRSLLFLLNFCFVYRKKYLKNVQNHLKLVPLILVLVPPPLRSILYKETYQNLTLRTIHKR